MILYTTDRAGAVLAQLTRATIESYSWRLNGSGACRFTLPNMRLPAVAYADAQEVTYQGQTVTYQGSPLLWNESAIDVVNDGRIRDVADPDQGHEVLIQDRGMVVWAGPLLTVDEQPDRLTFGAEGLLSYLKSMHVTTTLETSGYPAADEDDPGSGPIGGATVISQDQHLIVKALVDHGQGKAGADFRIDTSAVTASGTLRDRQYPEWELHNVYDEIQNLTQLTSVQGGCDVWIDPATRQLNCATPRRGKRRQATIFNDRNIRQFTRRLDKTRLETAVLGVGAGEGQDMVRRDRTDAAAVGRVGRLEGVATHKQVSRHATLSDHAAARLRERSQLPNLVSVTVATDDPQVGSYQVGDEVRVHYDSDYAFVDEFQRITQIEVQPAPPSGGETVAVLSLEPVGVS